MENEKQKVLILDQYMDSDISVYYFIIEIYHFEEKFSSYFVLKENSTDCWTDDITKATKFTSKAEAGREFFKYYYSRELKIKEESYIVAGFVEVTDMDKIENGDFAFVIRSVLEVFLEKENTITYIKNCTNKTASFYNIIALNKEDN
jgi:hypothetical protein